MPKASKQKGLQEGCCIGFPPRRRLCLAIEKALASVPSKSACLP